MCKCKRTQGWTLTRGKGEIIKMKRKRLLTQSLTVFKHFTKSLVLSGLSCSHINNLTREIYFKYIFSFSCLYQFFMGFISYLILLDVNQ